MGLGHDMAQDAMINSMIKEEEESHQQREYLYSTIRDNILKADNIRDLKLQMIVLLSLIKEKT